ncbi:phage tail assembly protein [Paraburkholderia caffeinilytica]|uniref:phage tail assembly protein n=1 Tax=Paraburkholderia caffeinilytica TaxID=1761016 RepID=UPI003DA1029C
MDEETCSEETYTLLTPIGGVTEIGLREPTLDELAKLSDDAQRFGNVRAMKNLLATMTGIEIASIGRMGARDFTHCNKFISAFFE